MNPARKSKNGGYGGCGDYRRMLYMKLLYMIILEEYLLYWACLLGLSTMIVELVDAGADLDRDDDRGRIVHTACSVVRFDSSLLVFIVIYIFSQRRMAVGVLDTYESYLVFARLRSCPTSDICLPFS